MAMKNIKVDKKLVPPPPYSVQLIVHHATHYSTLYSWFDTDNVIKQPTNAWENKHSK